MKKRRFQIFQLLFLFCLMAFLVAGLVKSVFFPHELNKYENRPANKFHIPGVSTIVDGSFQKEAEAALADQVFFAETFKKKFNDFSSFLVHSVMNGIINCNPEMYINMGDSLRIYGSDHLVYTQQILGNLKDGIDERAAFINSLKDDNVYVYFVEGDSDINFITGNKNGAFEYLENALSIDPSHIARFEITSFGQFDPLFFKTDHHWNSDGSYKGYLEVCDLLGITQPVPKGDRYTVSDSFSGSKTRNSNTSNFSEPFCAYHFVFPEYQITVNGKPVDDYGCQNHPQDMADVSYGEYYGWDYACTVITGGNGNANILLIGDSLDNAIIKLLAASFNELHSIDLRYYPEEYGSFYLQRYIEENSIDKVLFIGSAVYFSSPEFMMEE